MTDGLRGWLLGVVACALAVAMAQALTPEGTAKRIGRLAGGLLLLLAVLRPLLGGLWPAWSPPASGTNGETQRRENEALFSALVEQVGRHGEGEGSIP